MLDNWIYLLLFEWHFHFILYFHPVLKHTYTFPKVSTNSKKKKKKKKKKDNSMGEVLLEKKKVWKHIGASTI